MRTLRPFLIACAAILTLALPSPALAISPVTADCNAHTKLTHHYSVGQLRNALATMPADVKEYTSCYQTIQDQLYHQLGKTAPGSASASGASGGGSGISTAVLIVIIVIIVVGGGLAYSAWRRGAGGGGGGSAGPPAAPAG